MTKEEIARAKELDLLTYFKLVEPGNLKLVGKEYRHKVHSSLTISKDSLWCWHCIGLRGRTALKYLIDVEKIPYVEAVREINRIQGGVVHSSQPVSLPQPHAEPEAPRDFKLPEPDTNSYSAMAYLRGRCIHPNVLALSTIPVTVLTVSPTLLIPSPRPFRKSELKVSPRLRIALPRELVWSLKSPIEVFMSENPCFTSSLMLLTDVLVIFSRSLQTDLNSLVMPSRPFISPVRMPDASPLAADRTLLVLPLIVEAKPLTTDFTLSPMSPTGVFRLVFMEPDNVLTALTTLS